MEDKNVMNQSTGGHSTAVNGGSSKHQPVTSISAPWSGRSNYQSPHSREHDHGQGKTTTASNEEGGTVAAGLGETEFPSLQDLSKVSSPKSKSHSARKLKKKQSSKRFRVVVCHHIW